MQNSAENPEQSPEQQDVEKKPASNPAEADDRILADGHWSLKYGDDVYGPYTYEAMEGYIAEGRVAANSIIAPTGSEDWQEAHNVTVFAGFFDEERATVTASTPSHPRDRETVYGSKKGQVDRRKRPDTSNFIIITDIKSRHGATLEQTIMSLGSALKVANNAWVINCAGTAPGILNQLSKIVSKQDGLFVADATRDRTAWFNFGPETDAKIRRVWRKPV
ncbi:MAG: hypothetical protein RLN89_11470 [Parvibaculum sp.]